MIETVNTLSNQSSALKASSGNAVSSYVASAASSNTVSPSEFTGSRIRVDNLLDLAILEVRSGQGEVIRQYPTESQIRVFQRTAEIEARQAEVAAREARAQGETAAPTQQTASTDVASAAVDIPDINSYVPSSAPAPTTSAPSAPVTTSVPSGGDSVSVDA